MITKEKFEVYEEIRISGETNMFNIQKVIDLSCGELTRGNVEEIINNYETLMNKYPDVRRE